MSTSILTNTVAGSIFTASPPFSTSVTQGDVQKVMNPMVIQTELQQPEGTPLSLVIQNLSNASTLASHMNTMYTQGKLKDAATGEKMLAWKGSTTVASASGSTLTLRWRKGQPFLVPLVWGVVIISAILTAYFVIRSLMSSGTHWNLSKSVLPAKATATGPLGVPWWEWVLGGAAVVIVGPIAFHEYDRWVVEHGKVKQDLRRYGPV